MMLQRHAAMKKLDLHITVVESSKILTIGVGEGTTAVFRQMMIELGIDEAAFLRETGATIKFGIRHKEWLRKGHTYDGPIDDPEPARDQSGTEAGRAAIGDGHLCRLGRPQSVRAASVRGVDAAVRKARSASTRTASG